MFKWLGRVFCGYKEKGSKGECLVRDLLSSHRYTFTEQKSFDECRDKKLLRFDFFLPNENCCIEFDGAQHFKSCERFGGEKTFEEGKKRDKIKEKFCKENKIHLLRLKHTNPKKLTKEFLEGMQLVREAHWTGKILVMKIDHSKSSYKIIYVDNSGLMTPFWKVVYKLF